MSNLEDIIRTAHREHEGDNGNVEDLINEIKGQLADIPSIPRLGQSSKPLSLVSFQCLLQDTGYPMEVYLPGEHVEGEVDWSKLRERWVGWGVEIPGAQAWTNKEVREDGINPLPDSVHAKYPLPGRKGDYIGALIKVYDDVAFKPASTHHFIGILSTAPLPSNEPESAEVVPTIHVMKIVDEANDHAIEPDRNDLVDFLAGAFSPPDRTAGELLLLLLISSPASRPVAMSPLGTLSINFRRKDETATANFANVIGEVTPRVVNLPLSIDLLHSHPFLPSSTDSSSLDAGLLQLSEGTVLIVEEDAMGSGGKLEEKAVKNLKALAECMVEQRVRYEYPYMDGLKMDCAIRVSVLSQGKSLLPVDIDIPVNGNDNITSQAALPQLRAYLATASSARHSAKLEIPDDVAEIIQDAFVQGRRESANSAEATLKRRMKLARLMALSYPEGKLTKEVWERTVKLDETIESRK